MKWHRQFLASSILGGLFIFCGTAWADEPVTESVKIKMVLRNNQVRFIRGAKGETVSMKLTEAQKKLIRLNAPAFRGHTIRISQAHIRKGTNKIAVLIIKPSSSTPVLRVIPPQSRAGSKPKSK